MLFLSMIDNNYWYISDDTDQQPRKVDKSMATYVEIVHLQGRKTLSNVIKKEDSINTSDIINRNKFHP